VVAPNAALRLRAIRDFEDAGVKRVAGDEWLFEGPGTYYPRVEVQVVEITRAIVILPNQALKLRARKACIDRVTKTERKAGEEWLVRKTGAFSQALTRRLWRQLTRTSSPIRKPFNSKQ